MQQSENRLYRNCCFFLICVNYPKKKWYSCRFTIHFKTSLEYLTSNTSAPPKKHGVFWGGADLCTFFRQFLVFFHENFFGGTKAYLTHIFASVEISDAQTPKYALPKIFKNHKKPFFLDIFFNFLPKYALRSQKHSRTQIIVSRAQKVFKDSISARKWCYWHIWS